MCSAKLFALKSRRTKWKRNEEQKKWNAWELRQSYVHCAYETTMEIVSHMRVNLVLRLSSIALSQHSFPVHGIVYEEREIANCKYGGGTKIRCIHLHNYHMRCCDGQINQKLDSRQCITVPKISIDDSAITFLSLANKSYTTCMLHFEWSKSDLHTRNSPISMKINCAKFVMKNECNRNILAQVVGWQCKNALHSEMPAQYPIHAANHLCQFKCWRAHVQFHRIIHCTTSKSYRHHRTQYHIAWNAAYIIASHDNNRNERTEQEGERERKPNTQCRTQ